MDMDLHLLIWSSQNSPTMLLYAPQQPLGQKSKLCSGQLSITSHTMQNALHSPSATVACHQNHFCETAVFWGMLLASIESKVLLGTWNN